MCSLKSSDKYLIEYTKIAICKNGNMATWKYREKAMYATSNIAIAIYAPRVIFTFCCKKDKMVWK
ncbi:MAG TPA: hypothetical protein DCM28_01475 [Phycisphaerales bacterium]|nr:hypothetical protein [Phycisphaerales bacterium]